MTDHLSCRDIPITPADMLAGLGHADRSLLATCLALFDDSQLSSRLEKLTQQASAQLSEWGEKLRSRIDKAPAPLTAQEQQAAAREIGEQQRHWQNSHHDDDALRLLLWIRLRQALKLPAGLTRSRRGCSSLADDMAARLIHLLDPPGMVNSSHRWLHQKGWLPRGRHASTLAEVVIPMLDEFWEQSEQADQFADPTERRHHLTEAITALGQLDAEDQERLLSQTGATNIHDAALRHTVLLGGSLGAFGMGVSAAGFSGYILAAQASTFIPWVSGPGLVSFVSVMSNPITIFGIAGGGGWWLLNRAREKVSVAIAARVIAMLTLNGLGHGRIGLEGALRCFPRVSDLSGMEGLESKTLQEYCEQWQQLATLPNGATTSPSESVLSAMGRTPGRVDARANRTTEDPLAGNEHTNALAMGLMTIGDIIYCRAAIDPEAIAAADFSRVADINDTLDFAQLADQIMGGSDASMLGGISQLKGYVAEQAVAARLVAAGHTVSLPDTANNPGWDLLVDGQPFQVKFHASLAGLREHFEHYHYPVIANTELTGVVERLPDEWTDNVFFLEGLSNELIEEVTRESLAAGAELLNPSVVPMAGIISAARGLLAYRRGVMSGQQALEQVVLDGTVRMSLAGAGGVAGTGVGLMLFGPAGAWVFGAGAPMLSQMFTSRATRWLRHNVRSNAHRQWEDAAHEALHALQCRLNDALTARQAQLAEKQHEITASVLEGYLYWRLEDDRMFCRECLLHLWFATRERYPQPERRLTELLEIMQLCGVHQALYQRELHNVSKRLQERPGLRELMDNEQLAEFSRKAHSTASDWWASASRTVETRGWNKNPLKRWRQNSDD
ncbi:hypothetical protein [Kushneria phosphatilytica]|uniref:Uncharacterized protein n=1 Tax=Kushneria phosphatilytica TaxID=657387 RepID=A0A1S1NQU3_9GAMM|nr:hypothetical protein [Kushneria phosphatilytica]OHV08016.1 hypothetical protein BH688_14625 [Kushneria phosphatilytica]QEL09952.1 hypothetical protein FY550_01600 [Kushneria phosphatilytica]